MRQMARLLHLFFLCFVVVKGANAAIPDLMFTVNMSEAVNVSGCPADCPRIAIDVGGQARYAEYSAGTGTSSLTFSYSPVVGDVDLDGITLISPIDLNGGAISDLSGNSMTNLTFTVPNSSGVKVDYPSLSMNFISGASGRYTLNGTAYPDFSSFLSASGGTFTRNSIATYFDSTGTLQVAATNQPRFDHDPVTHQPRGVLIEESRTNYVRNSEFSGAAVGVVPIGISVNAGGAGITAQITDVGVMHGERYIEVRFSGMSTSAGTIFPSVFFTKVGELPSSVVGDTWTASIRIISDVGSSPSTPRVQIAEISDSNVFLGATEATISAGTRQAITRVVSNPSVSAVRFILLTSLTQNQTIDRTIRFSIPQLEKGLFQTSYIPTTGAIATRQADRIVLPLGDWYLQSIGSLYAEASAAHGSRAAGDQNIIAFDTGVFDGRFIRIGRRMTKAARVQISNTSTQFDHSFAVWNDDQMGKVSLAYQLNNFASSYNGGAIIQDDTGDVPIVSRMVLGGFANDSTSFWSGPVHEIKYYPSRLSDAQLQLMTQ